MLTPAAAPRGLAQARLLHLGTLNQISSTVLQAALTARQSRENVDNLAAVFRALVVNSLHYLEWPKMLTPVVERIRAMLTPSSCGMHVCISV